MWRFVDFHTNLYYGVLLEFKVRCHNVLMKSYCIYSVIRQKVALEMSQKNLGLSNKTELEFWDCFGKDKTGFS